MPGLAIVWLKRAKQVECALHIDGWVMPNQDGQDENRLWVCEADDDVTAPLVPACLSDMDLES